MLEYFIYLQNIKYYVTKKSQRSVNGALSDELNFFLSYILDK